MIPFSLFFLCHLPVLSPLHFGPYFHKILKVNPIDTLSQKKNYFAPTESHWLYKTHVRAGPMSHSRWSTQNKLNSTFRDVLFCNRLLGNWFLSFFLSLTGLLLVYYVFRLCFYGVLVCVSLSVHDVCL